MSAFIVGHKTLDAIAFAAMGGIVRASTYSSPVIRVTNDGQDYGESLLLLNLEAVKYRYGSLDRFPQRAYWKYNEEREFDLMQCIKSCQCWMYQCAEADKFMNDPLFIEVKEIKAALCEELAMRQSEYELANWGD